MKMSVTDSAYYSIRGIPREVDHTLRDMAARRGTSLNRLIGEELTRTALGSIQKADFSDLVGRWVPDPGFDDVISSQRQIDREKWK